MLLWSRGHMLLLALSTLAFYLRARGIRRDHRCVWDEHFQGRFANNYIARDFYLDVHPPIGKLFIAMLFRGFGYAGGFDFASGATYPLSVPYGPMRLVQALLGSLLVPAAYGVCRALHLPRTSAWMAAVFVTLESALVGISRIILLDSTLLLANAAALWAFATTIRGTSSRARLLVLGLALGVAISTKLVGLLTMAVIGMHTFFRLVHFGKQRKLAMSLHISIWMEHGLFLGVLPLAIYMFGFWCHFALLQNYTPQADNMGSEYSLLANGSALQIQPPFIYSGSFVTIRANAYPFNYLTAVPDYTGNSTAEPLLRTTNVVKVESYLGINVHGHSWYLNHGVVEDGDLVSLHTPRTSYYISVLSAEVPSSQYQPVGFAGVASSRRQGELAANTWMVVHDSKRGNGTRPISTTFRLVSKGDHCELAIQKPSQLGDSGSTLVCIPGKGTVWGIEHQLATNNHPATNITQTVTSNFRKNFVTYSRLMYRINQMLVSDPDQYSVIESAASSWPLLRYPMPLVPWSSPQPKYMLVGNMVLWWASSFVCVIGHPVLTILAQVVARRSHGQIQPRFPPNSMHLLWCLWAAHYLPFLFAQRATYLHHYLPALYHAILLLAAYTHEGIVVLAAILSPGMQSGKRSKVTSQLISCTIALVAAGFWFSWPFVYGMDDPCAYRRFNLITSWNVCRQGEVYF